MDRIVLKFSERLRKLRLKNHLTQLKLSELSGIEYRHIQLLESKTPCDIKISTLFKLAKAFNMSASKLIDLD